jgi:hypothetical protein
MTERKTKKLTCIITGKSLIATKPYYERKVKKIGTEEELHRTYVCKEAKNLLIKGYDVAKIREMLNVDMSSIGDVPEDVIADILNSNKPKFKSININNMPISSILNPKTDPEVKSFIDHILNQENN